MKKVIIYEPAMCCPTGLCGVGADPELLRISTLVEMLSAQGFIIERHNLSNAPQEFVNNVEVSGLIEKEGMGTLPITVIDGSVVKKGAYPSNGEMTSYFGLTVKAPSSQDSGGCSCGSGGCCG